MNQSKYSTLEYKGREWHETAVPSKDQSAGIREGASMVACAAILKALATRMEVMGRARIGALGDQKLRIYLGDRETAMLDAVYNYCGVPADERIYDLKLNEAQGRMTIKRDALRDYLSEDEHRDVIDAFIRELAESEVDNVIQVILDTMDEGWAEAIGFDIAPFKERGASKVGPSDRVTFKGGRKN